MISATAFAPATVSNVGCGFDVLGFALESWRVPLGPLVLGLILGTDVEQYFLQSMNKTGDGGFLALLDPARPIAVFLGVACIVIWLLPAIIALVRRAGRRAPPPAGS